jgi:hypothetical protein
MKNGGKIQIVREEERGIELRHVTIKYVLREFCNGTAG